MLNYTRSICTAAGSSLRVGATVLGVAAGTVFGEKGADANIMRSLADNPAHIAYGNQFTIAGRQALGLGGGVVSMESSAPGTSLRARWSGVAIKSFGDGSGWILSSNHPYGDLTNLGFGQETITIGTWGNYITSGETRLVSTYSVAVGNSGSRDPNRNDLRLYFVSSGLSPFSDMPLLSMEQLPVGSYATVAGFGRYGTQADGIFPRSGDIRAFTSLYDGQMTGTNYSSSFYRRLINNSFDSTPLLGRSSDGYSGSMVEFLVPNSSGGFDRGLGGIGSFGTNGTAYTGNSGFNFFTQDLISEINSITAVPAPGISVTLALAAATLASRRRR